MSAVTPSITSCDALFASFNALSAHADTKESIMPSTEPAYTGISCLSLSSCLRSLVVLRRYAIIAPTTSIASKPSLRTMVKQAMNFAGQNSGELAGELIRALSRTMKQRSPGENLPDLESFMQREPVADQTADGDQSIYIYFRENIQELLDRWDTDLPTLIASVTGTLFTFVPRVSWISVQVGETPVTEMNNRYHSSKRSDSVEGLIKSGVYYRGDAAEFLTGTVRVFLGKDGKLTACEKPVEREEADSPRAMLEALLEGPDRREAEKGITATIPAGVSKKDILNVAVYNDTLLVKLSPDFLLRIRENGPEKEKLLCYSMVNTLCLNTGMKRVSFFFGDEQAETIAGEIYWAGEFIYNPDL